MPKRKYAQNDIEMRAQDIRRGPFVWKAQPRYLQYLRIPNQDLRHLGKTIKALVSDPYDLASCERAIRMDNCSNGYPCQERHCPRCRAFIQEREARRVNTLFGQTPQNRLKFLTLLLPVSYDPITDLPVLRQATAALLHNQFKKTPGIRVYGTFEIDIKDRWIDNSPKSQPVLEALGMDWRRADPAYLLHLHAIVDLGNHKRDKVRQVIAERFDKPYQVRLAAFRKEQSRTENLTRIAHYMTKYRLQYADNIYGKKIYEKATYGSFYPDHVVRNVVKSYSCISKQYVIRFKFNL